MRRILLTSIVLVVLLTACSAPVQVAAPSTEADRDFTYGIYEFTFTVEQLSGRTSGDWDFVYTYNGEEIKSGHQIVFSLEIFSFHSIRIDIIKKDSPDNAYSAVLPVAVCDGGSGKTEVTVTGSDGYSATFRIICNVTQLA